MRIDGTYKEWEKNKIKENKISFIKEQIQAIEEWRDMKAPEFFNNVGVNQPMLEKEKWDMDVEKIQKEADEALEKYTEVLEELENEE
jgi:glutamine synthetase type III